MLKQNVHSPCVELLLYSSKTDTITFYRNDINIMGNDRESGMIVYSND